MITRMWTDGGMRVAVELDDGDGGLIVTDYSTDPPRSTDVPTLDGDHWIWVEAVVGL